MVFYSFWREVHTTLNINNVDIQIDDYIGKTWLEFATDTNNNLDLTVRANWLNYEKDLRDIIKNSETNIMECASGSTYVHMDRNGYGIPKISDEIEPMSRYSIVFMNV